MVGADGTVGRGEDSMMAIIPASSLKCPEGSRPAQLRSLHRILIDLAGVRREADPFVALAAVPGGNR